jgi:transposase
MNAGIVPLVALDIHKKFSFAVVLDQNGNKLDERKLLHNDRQALADFFESFQKGTEAVMEATFNWPWLADAAREHGLKPVLAHPPRARQMAKGLPKTDRRDATFLGKLRLAYTVFPEAWAAPPDVRMQRDVFRLRLQLVRSRTALKNAVHGQLFRLGVQTDNAPCDLFSKSGRVFLEHLDLEPNQRFLIETKLVTIDDLNRQIETLDETIIAGVKEDPRADILMSIPGIGKLSAFAILAELGDINRFADRRALASYAGVLPKNHESAGHDFGKHTGGQCNEHLRLMAIECVTGAVKGSKAMRSLHSRVKSRNRKAAGKARIAVAREIIELVWTLLKRGEKYREPNV